MQKYMRFVSRFHSDFRFRSVQLCVSIGMILVFYHLMYVHFPFCYSFPSAFPSNCQHSYNNHLCFVFEKYNKFYSSTISITLLFASSLSKCFYSYSCMYGLMYDVYVCIFVCVVMCSTLLVSKLQCAFLFWGLLRMNIEIL